MAGGRPADTHRSGWAHPPGVNLSTSRQTSDCGLGLTVARIQTEHLPPRSPVCGRIPTLSWAETEFGGLFLFTQTQGSPALCSDLRLSLRATLQFNVCRENLPPYLRKSLSALPAQRQRAPTPGPSAPSSFSSVVESGRSQDPWQSVSQPELFHVAPAPRHCWPDRTIPVRLHISRVTQVALGLWGTTFGAFLGLPAGVRGRQPPHSLRSSDGS